MKDNKYDVIIIGAGVSGLVCGCFLAKYGKKVLVVEKNDKPGGYCTSFAKKQFIFDACAHSIGGCREGGSTRRIFTELGIYEQLSLKRYSPTDIIVAPDFQVSFFDDLRKTIESFHSVFPKESKKIEAFFNSIVLSKDMSLFLLRKSSFSQVLNKYFDNSMLGSVFSILLLGNAGLPASLISGYSGSMIFREFILDGGYYPKGGMQALPNSLSEKLVKYGGELHLSKKVKKIDIKGKKVNGIHLSDNSRLSANYVVCACDISQFASNFLDAEVRDSELLKSFFAMKSSLSMFILYLGFKKNFIVDYPFCSNVWYLPSYDVANLYLAANKKDNSNMSEFMIRILPDQKSAVVFVNANFQRKLKWESDKEKVAQELLKKVKKIVPFQNKDLEYRGIVAPNTLFEWTYNSQGAAYGWAALPNQVMVHQFSKPFFFENFYLTGHWTTMGHGLSGVINLGYLNAMAILRKKTNTFI